MPKPTKQTSSSVSSIASKYVRMTNADMEFLTRAPWDMQSHRAKVRFFRDIRKLAASCLAQDETKGQRSAERKGKK